MLNKKEHLPLLERLSANLGKENVGLSCSGWGIDDETAQHLATVAGDVEMTMDAHPETSFAWRPRKYHSTAANAARLLKRYGARVGFQTVVTREHLNNQRVLTDLYHWFCENGIDAWSILKFFPSGRGENFQKLALSDDENRIVVDRIHLLVKRNQSPVKPKVDVHYLMPGSEKSPECRCVRKSVGILPDGKVTACFWGLSQKGKLADNKFYLGDVREDSMNAIMGGKRAEYWLCRENGGCALGKPDLTQAAD